MRPGEVFANGKYTLLKKLRASGMAEVWLARQHGREGFAKDVVIKRILPHLSEDEKLVTMFLDEARIAANLNHPNVVQIFDLGSDGDNYFIAMEYIRGYDLEQIQEQLKSRHLAFPAEIGAKIIADTCLGLAYAHDCKTADGAPMQVVHRDVSPQNILVSETGVVKLIDFGIAKARTSSTRTQVGHTKGKICYMSPEQMMARELDRRSDIFSTGVVMYELLCGEKPFDGENLLACFHKLMKEGILAPRQVRGDLAPKLENIIMTALERDREDRYPTATALRYELQKYLDGESVSLGPEHLGDFLRWLFNPDDSTQVMFDLPKQKQKQKVAAAARQSSPMMSTPGGTPPLPPAAHTARRFGTEDRLTAPSTNRSTDSHPLQRSQPNLVGTGPALGRNDNFGTFGNTQSVAGSNPSMAINPHHTGPQLGLSLEFDNDSEHMPHRPRRSRRSGGSSMLIYAFVFLLLLGGGFAGAHFAGFFGDKAKKTIIPPRLSGQKVKINSKLPPLPPRRRKIKKVTKVPIRKKPVVRKRVKPRPKPRRHRRKAKPHKRKRRKPKCSYGYLILEINKGLKHPKVNISGGGYTNLPILQRKRIRAGRHRFGFLWLGGPGGQKGDFKSKFLTIYPCMNNKYYCKLDPKQIRCERE